MTALRVLLVDDSPAVRELLTQRLAERGYDVTSAADPLRAAEMAMAEAPDVVVTDLWMPGGVSGVQLCRLLRAEPRTAHVPVILITGASQRRSRFWAKTAGAAAYVPKDDPIGLYATLERVARERPGRRVPPRAVSRVPMQQRLFQRLDADLFASVVAGEVRSLAHEEGEAEGVFRGLATLLSEVSAYRWLAVRMESPPRLFLHTERSSRVAAEAEAREALAAPSDTDAVVVCDDRAVDGYPGAPIVADVMSGGRLMGKLAIGAGGRGPSLEDRELVSVVAAELGGPLRIVALVDHARHVAMSDPLTGLLNRRAATDMMARSLASYERYGEPLSILLLDVDHFKRVNDTFGHEGGDAVLVALADVLRGLGRRTDFVARWGGEEFVVGLAHTALPAAAIPAERIRQVVMDRPILLPCGDTISVTVSIGVASALPGERIDALIARADQAMYVAKARGRNRSELHDGRTSMVMKAASIVPIRVVPPRITVSR